MDNVISATEFCRENNVYFNLNLYQRAIVDAKKKHSTMFFGSYLRLLNLNKGTHGEKEFKDSLFEVEKDVVGFHETPRFEIRQTKHHCRNCGEDKSAGDFFSSSSPLDKTGVLSVCKTCVKEIFSGFYQDHSDLSCAIYETCALLDYGYHKDVVVKLTNELNETVLNKTSKTNVPDESEQMLLLVDTEDIFGRYLKLCSETVDIHKAGRFDFYSDRPAGYEDYSSPLSLEEQIEVKTAEKASNLKKKWGKGYSAADIEELESFYSEWTHKDLADPSVALLIRQLCMHQLDMAKTRMGKPNEDGDGTDQGGTPDKNDYDILTKLMEKAGAIKDKVSTDDAQSKESWGTFIRKIEVNNPAEYLDKRKDKYFDVNNIDQYINALFVRSLKNFITGSRDFNVMIDDTAIDGIEKETNGESNGKT